MSAILWTVDIVACWVLFVVAGIFLAANGAYTPRQVLGTIGLILVFVGSFVGAAVIWQTGHRAWWAVIVRVGGALTAVYLYDGKFGLNRHMAMLLEGLRALPRRIAEYPKRWTPCSRNHGRSASGSARRQDAR